MILLIEALAEEEVAVDAGAELADVAGAEEELVAGDFGVCRGLTKGRDKELGPAMHEFGDDLPLFLGCGYRLDPILTSRWSGWVGGAHS